MGRGTGRGGEEGRERMGRDGGEAERGNERDGTGRGMAWVRLCNF